MEQPFNWIKASEELPKLGSKVLYLSLGGVSGVPKQDIWYRGLALYADIGYGPKFYHGNEVYRVIYWAYFPEMPKHPGADA